MTDDSNSNNTLLTPGVINTTTERNLTRNRDQKDVIIQFTVACFTALFDALCTLNSNLHLSELWFSRCRASYKRLLFLD